MSFIRTNFSPVGAQGRAGVVPQVFAYTSPDARLTIIGDGYFPTNPTDPKQNMLGVFKPQDWIMVTHDTGGAIGFSILFIDNDGSDGNPITVHTVEINAT